VLSYDAAGTLRFSGGITASRGHEGANTGRTALTDLVRAVPSQHPSTPAPRHLGLWLSPPDAGLGRPFVPRTDFLLVLPSSFPERSWQRPTQRPQRPVPRR
jgi:hypothetical protein